MSEYLRNEKNNTFTWLSSLYNPFKHLAPRKREMQYNEIKKNAILNFTNLSSNWDTWNFSERNNSS